MKRYIAHITLASLAGTGLTYLALTMTPLRAQVLNRPIIQSPNSEPGWILLGHGHRGRRTSWGRDWNRSGSCPMYDGVYDSQEVETIQGQVISTEQVDGGQGTWLRVQTDQETLIVHLGPAWYLESQDVAIALNDTIEVTGVRRTLDNETNFIASEIEHAGRIIELRDDNGYPIWMNRRTIRSPM
ncbi:MAG: hypothetical protein AAGA75_02625 [Cyanobacteria bacterium P01_E01_bin.6]